MFDVHAYIGQSTDNYANTASNSLKIASQTYPKAKYFLNYAVQLHMAWLGYTSSSALQRKSAQCWLSITSVGLQREAELVT